MFRGTTPEHTFTTDLDLTTASVIYLTYKQNNKKVLEFEKQDLTVTSEDIKVKLTQVQTLGFSMHGSVHIQIRARFPDGTAVASNIMSASVEEILKDGEI